MKNERAWPNEFKPPLDQLVTDSMILSETYVDSAIRGQRARLGECLRPAQGIINGMIIGLLFWLLTLLPFVAFRFLF